MTDASPPVQTKKFQHDCLASAMKVKNHREPTSVATEESQSRASIITKTPNANVLIIEDDEDEFDDLPISQTLKRGAATPKMSI